MQQQSENTEKKHKRRIHYSGTHPKSYQEKYKEHQPEKYADTISKVISKGSTPAGMHISICVKEILDFLQIQPGQKGLDATLGYGGHTLEMLKCLNGQGHIYALDVDPIESAKTKKRLEEKGYGSEILTIKLENFANIDKVAEKLAKPFPCVRVDLYNIDGKIYFGELTFTSYGGLQDFYTDEFQKLAGSKIDLSGVKTVK